MTEDLKKRIQSAVVALKRAGAKEVFLFGSAAKGTAGKGSDVDMAVSGLPPRSFFKAMGEAADLLGADLDLVDLDEKTPFTRFLREEKELIRVG